MDNLISNINDPKTNNVGLQREDCMFYIFKALHEEMIYEFLTFACVAGP